MTTRTRASVAGVIVAAVGAAASVLLLLGATRSFFPAYLAAFTFWMGLSLGCLALLMVHQLLGGVWSEDLLPTLRAGTATVPLLIPLAAPLTLGLSRLYPWTQAALVAADPALHRRTAYLNMPFFLLRGAGYLLAWTALAYVLLRIHAEVERRPRGALVVRLRRLSAAGLVMIGFTVTFAVIDWLMTMEPEWHSSIYPAIIGIGGLLAALAACVVLSEALRLHAAEDDRTRRVRRDHAGLIIALTITWAYLSYSQLLLVWSGDLPYEAAFYLARLQPSWRWLPFAFIAGELFLPLAILIWRTFQDRARFLVMTAAVIVVAHAVELTWLVLPAARADVHAAWLTAALLCAMGGVWFVVFAAAAPPRQLETTA